jgi:cytochrome c oxidase subunit 4
MPRGTLTLFAVWIGLMLLLATTVAATFAPLGPVKPLVNFAVAFAKAGLIFWFFMHLREQDWLARLVAVAAAAWLMILLGLTQTDLFTRGLLHR